jgi:hypothetical protein
MPLAMQATCHLCECTDALRLPSYFDGERISCRRCGDYEITGRALQTLPRLSIEERQQKRDHAIRSSHMPHGVPRIVA